MDRIMDPAPRITQLATTIAESVARLQQILVAQNTPSPSFDEGTSTSFSQEASHVRDVVLDATAELHDLLLEPLRLVYMHGSHNNSVCLQAISRFGIASLVPSGGQTSYAHIAQQTGLPEHIVRRLLRHAITMRIFREPGVDQIAHTKASRMLANPTVNDWLRVGTEEMWPAAVKMVDALQRWPGSSDPGETGYSLAHNTSGIYEVIGRSPERAARFANAMQVYSTRPDYDPSFIINHFDWASLGRAQVVDIGGAHGHIAIQLASHFDNIDVMVQDMAQVVEGADEKVPDVLKGRVRFMAHDLFAPQSVQADVIFFRWILHNWSDEHCVRILRAQIPVLKPGVLILIQDTIMPEPGAVPLWKERCLRMDDLNMAAVFNARERTAIEWRALVTDADSRFSIASIVELEGSALGIIEVVWTE